MEEIISFIKQTCMNANIYRVILGLSGGLDSAVVAALCVKALGSDSVIAVMMPYTANKEIIGQANNISNQLKIKTIAYSITDIVNNYFINDNEASLIRKGNFMARIRMCILYDLSAKYNALVVGTSNLSEILTGYTTQYGDSACAFKPIAHLLKTEVFTLAKALNIPQEIINRTPSGDLWEGQTDEDELGITYENLDRILQLIHRDKLDREDVLKQGILPEEYELVMKKIKQNYFKRIMPLVIE